MTQHNTTGRTTASARICQRSRYQEARLEGRIYEKRGRGEDIPDRKLTWHTARSGSRLENGAALVVLAQFRPRCAVAATFWEFATLLAGKATARVATCRDGE